MYDLIRFFDKKEYAEIFLKGQLYMNSLGYFWANGFQDQQDLFEGTVSFVDPHNTLLPDDLTKHIIGSVMNRLEAMKYCNLLCMVRHGYDPVRKQVERINPLMKNFGKYAIIVKNLEVFVNRVYDAMVSKKDCYGLMGPVSYHRRDEILARSDCFDKLNRFSWQNEWRIVWLNNYKHLKEIAKADPNATYEVACTLDIGDNSDIAEIYESKVLFENIQAIYPGYREVNKIFENKKARELVNSGIPAVYDIFCDSFIGWSPRRSFLQKIMEIDGGKYKPLFSIG